MIITNPEYTVGELKKLIKGLPNYTPIKIDLVGEGDEKTLHIREVWHSTMSKTICFDVEKK